MLVRFFGRVPLIDSLFTDPAAQNNVPQSTAAQIYAFIESDLTFAAANLPLNWDAKFVGRATRGAANGLLAKVYLTQQKWAPAMTAANAVITSTQYDLSTPYDRIFREEGENSKESVFEVQATASANIQTANGVQYAQIMGVRGAGVWDLGWGWTHQLHFLKLHMKQVIQEKTELFYIQVRQQLLTRLFMVKTCQPVYQIPGIIIKCIPTRQCVHLSAIGLVIG